MMDTSAGTATISRTSSSVTDPVYLTEPLIRQRRLHPHERPVGNWLWPCEYVDEIVNAHSMCRATCGQERSRRLCID